MSRVISRLRLAASRTRLQQLTNLSEQLDKELDQELRRFNINKLLVERQRIDDYTTRSAIFDEISDRMKRINDAKQVLIDILRS